MLKKLFLVWVVALLAMWDFCVLPIAGAGAQRQPPRLFAPQPLLAQYVATAFTPNASGGAITRVEIVTGIPGTAMTLGTATTSGELIVVFAVEGHDGSTYGSVSDSASQPYTQVWQGTANGIQSGWTATMWYFQNSASGVTSVTVALGTGQGASYSACWVAHYKGVVTSGALDKSAVMGTAPLSSPWSSTSVTTTSANEVLVGAGFFYTGGTLASSGSWSTLVTKAESNGDDVGFADQIVSATGSYAFTGTSSKSYSYAGIATFK